MVVFKIRDSGLSARYSRFVVYCVYGESGSSLLIESTDSMSYITGLSNCVHHIPMNYAYKINQTNSFISPFPSLSLPLPPSPLSLSFPLSRFPTFSTPFFLAPGDSTSYSSYTRERAADTTKQLSHSLRIHTSLLLLGLWDYCTHLCPSGQAS